MDSKTMLVGALERDGKGRMDVVEGRDRERLHGFVQRHVAEQAEAIFTDAWPAYRGVEDSDKRHETVNHSDSEWVPAEAMSTPTACRSSGACSSVR